MRLKVDWHITPSAGISLDCPMAEHRQHILKQDLRRRRDSLLQELVAAVDNGQRAERLVGIFCSS